MEIKLYLEKQLLDVKDKIRVKGKVTEVHHSTISFTLNNDIEVHLGYHFKKIPKIPRFASQVAVEGILKDKHLIAIKLECSDEDLRESKTCNTFFKLLSDFRLSLFDAQKLFSILIKHETEPPFSPQFLHRFNREDFSFSVGIFRCFPTFRKDFVEESIFDDHDFRFVVPSEHLELSSYEKPTNTAAYSFSVNNCKNNYLIGYLYVSRKSGGYLVVANSSESKIICEITAKDRTLLSQKLSILLNNFVVIKNYTFFGDHVKDNRSLMSLLVNMEDVYLLCPKKKPIESLNPTFQFTIYVSVFFRTSVTLNRFRRKLECLVLCNVRCSKDDQYRLCFLRLEGETFQMYPLFNAGDRYILQTDNPSLATAIGRPECEPTLCYNKGKYPVYYMPAGGVLRFQGKSPAIEYPNNMKQVLEMLESADGDMCSFEALISRRYADPDKYYNSRKDPRDNRFSIAGKDIHNIKLTSCPTEADSQKLLFYEDNIAEGKKLYFANLSTKEYDETIALYLRNITYMLRPHLLVPGMRIRLHNVSTPKARRYLLPNMYTFFEILEYMPTTQFETTPELRYNLDWGPRSKLGDSCGMPYNSLVWGPTTSVHLTSLAVNVNCRKCKKPYRILQTQCCGIQDNTQYWEAYVRVEIGTGLVARDNFGVFDVFANEITFQKYFGLRPLEAFMYKILFYNIKHWEHKTKDRKREFSSCKLGVSKLYIDHLLAILFASQTESHSGDFDWKCRKRGTDLLFHNREKFFLEDCRNRSADLI